ncbi:metalloendopeptidase [Coemansia interrupta]|uniref:Metalloendopeptidase n=1 Tax=Coemansia interrupta TaxID=1126814 RepID=A0A9W8HJS2_9FUNG|nr:metalloendopeptidase [Coemansia interrupta]
MTAVSSTANNESARKGSVLNFDVSPSDIKKTVDRLISEAKATHDAVAAQTNPTFDNVVVPLAMRENKRGADYAVITFLQNVSTDKDVRDASTEAEERLEAFEIESQMREDLYKVVHAVYTNKDEMDKLGDEDRRLVEKMELGFQQSGLGLNSDDRSRLGEIRKQLSELGIKFSRNVNENDGRETFTREELAGLPDSFFDGRETEVVDGVEKYIVTTKYPDMVPVMQLASSERTRRRLMVTNEQRCPENVELMQEAIALRLEAARLLGYKTHAEFVLVEKMAKTPKAVMDFEHDLRGKLNELARGELKEYEEAKRADKKAAGEEYDGLFNWDFRYYANLIKERKHSVNEEEVKQYLPMKEVTRGILDIYQNMLSLRFAKVENPPVWHPDVEMYEVWEAMSNEFVGHFYLDLYPRDAKYNHAAVWPIRSGYAKEDGTHEYPVAAMVANFPKATSSAPALLTHTDAITLLHELGHVFHGICSLTKWGRFHGTQTEGDFVEAPSQMLENWGWEPSVLSQFAVHYKTGEPIPADLVKRMVAAKNEGAGLFNLRQVFFGLFDMAIHDTTDGKVDAKAAYNRLREDVSMFKNGDTDTWGMATFGHMMGGYDAGYYGYLWSQVFSADIADMYASRFLKDGVESPKTGMDYRREILRPGGSRDASVSLEKFLGRKPNNKAFLRSIGLASSE